MPQVDFVEHVFLGGIVGRLCTLLNFHAQK
jgi:hypothetical protein